MIQNAVFVIPQNKIYKSWHRHDCASFEFNGYKYFLDGGNEDYIRTNIPVDENFRWICINDSEDVESVIDKYAHKKDGGNVFIKEMSVEELLRVREESLHPLIQEAIRILISRKSSVLDYMM